MALKIKNSLLSERDKIFVPLPKEQQLTEESLIELERNLARAGKKNDAVLIESIKIAAESMPCSNSISEGQKVYKKAKK